MKIAIYGAASDEIPEKYKDAVFNLSKALGERGHSLIFGAGNGGLMGAAARGFHSVGSEVLGVAPTFFMGDTVEELYKESDITIYTDNMGTRKSVIESNADAFIIVPGGIGTYDEFFQVLTMKQLKCLNKPIVLFNAYGFYTPFDSILKKAMKEKFLRSDTKDLCRCYTEEELEQIVEYIESPVSDSGEAVTSSYGMSRRKK